MAETGRSKNPNADPRQKHSPHSPHSPNRSAGEGEMGNEGNGGKDIPVSEAVSSNFKRASPGWSGRL